MVQNKIQLTFPTSASYDVWYNKLYYNSGFRENRSFGGGKYK